MSAPQVEGAIVLLLRQGSTPLEAIDQLLRSADRVGCPTASPTCRGRINLDTATAG